MGSSPVFTVVLRGYDRADVDALASRLTAALSSSQPQERSEALQAVRQARFGLAFRGYDRRQVEQWLDRVQAELATTA